MIWPELQPLACDRSVTGTLNPLGTFPDLEALFLYEMRLSGTIGINGTEGGGAHWMWGNANLSGTLPDGNLSSWSWQAGSTRISGTLHLSFLQNNPNLIQFSVTQTRLSGLLPENITAPGNKQQPGVLLPMALHHANPLSADAPHMLHVSRAYFLTWFQFPFGHHFNWRVENHPRPFLHLLYTPPSLHLPAFIDNPDT